MRLGFIPNSSFLIVSLSTIAYFRSPQPKLMKKTVFLFCLMTLLVLAACKKDDVIDDPGTTVPPETSISFTCKDSLGIPDIFVGIAPQSADRDSGIFLMSGLTDGYGKIKFTGMDPQTFYYRASRTTSNGVVKRNGSVTAEKDKKKYVTVTF